MTAQPLQISWNNFTWGISDNKYQSQPGRYYQAYNVDTRRYDVTPSKKHKIVYTYPENINCVFSTSVIDGGVNNIVWLSDGKIYQDSTLKHTLTLWQEGYKIGYLNVWGTYYLYYFNDKLPSSTPKYIHRSGIDGGWFSDWHLTYDSTEWNPNYVPPAGMIVISEWVRIIFSHYNKIFEIDNTETVNELISLPPSENVVWITQFQNSYKIYTTTWFIESKVYLWDWLWSLVETDVKLWGIAITSVVNNWAYDYFVAENNLFMMAGVQYQKLYHKIQESGRMRILWVVEDDVYIYNNNLNSNKTISIYGSKPWYSKSFTPIYAVSDEISRFTYNADNVFYAVWTSLYTDVVISSASSITSYIESICFMWTNIQYEKAIESIILKFSGTSADCTIKLECKINEWSWTEIWSGTNATISTQNHGLKIYKSMFLNPLWNFNTIRFKVSFISNGIAQCKFYGIDLFGSENIGK